MMAGKNWRNRRVRVGSGEPLRRYRWWQMFGRSLRSITLRSDAGTMSTYTIDVRHAGDMTDGEIRARLYVDGALQSYAKMPTRFAVPGGHIEVAITGFGLKRCHYVRADGTEQQLSPDPRSAEGRRARLHERHPGVSRVIGLVSIAFVVVGLGVEVPQIIEALSRIPLIADSIGTFTSPLRLPLELNLLVGLAAVLGSTERALRMRSSWIDELAS
jgi:catechol 2,3-dioxygenase-like lactoylglutathione lyase family enzyme